MRRSGRVALGHVRIDDRDRPAMIEPHRAGLMMSTLRTQDELVSADFVERPESEIPGEMIEIAEAIIARRAGNFDAKTLRDRYQDELRRVEQRPGAPPGAALARLRPPLARHRPQLPRRPCRRCLPAQRHHPRLLRPHRLPRPLRRCRQAGPAAAAPPPAPTPAVPQPRRQRLPAAPVCTAISRRLRPCACGCGVPASSAACVTACGRDAPYRPCACSCGVTTSSSVPADAACANVSCGCDRTAFGIGTAAVRYGSASGWGGDFRRGSVIASRSTASDSGLTVLEAEADGPHDIGSEILLHIMGLGDRRYVEPGWAGNPGSKRQIEALSIRPREGLAASSVEFRVFAQEGRATAWVSNGNYAGTRGRNLPLTGFAVRPAGEAGERLQVEYEGSFFEGGVVGPKRNGELCVSPVADDPLEAIRVTIVDRGD